jgi:hypothetical protein
MRSASRPSAATALLLTFATCLSAQAHAFPQAAQQQPNPLSQSTIEQNANPQGAATKTGAPLPIGEETHHELLLKNDYVNVYGVNIPAQDATLPFHHDQPYLAISIGPSDVEMTANDTPQERQTFRDGDTAYIPDPGTIVVRPTGDRAYRGVALELLKPQGGVRFGDGSVRATAGQTTLQSPKSQTRKQATQPSETTKAADSYLFQTDELYVQRIRLLHGGEFSDAKPAQAALMVALADSTLSVTVGDALSLLHDGDVLWLPAGRARTMRKFLDQDSSFLLISFKDAVVGK